MNTNINFSIDGIKFNYRIAGVTIDQGRVLLHQAQGSKIWSLPGGRCAINEDSQYALEREYEEEMGQKVKVVRPIYLFENFFSFKKDDLKEKIHEVSMIYLVEFPEGSELLEKSEFDGVEGEKKLRFKWFELARLPEVDFYPVTLREKLQNIPEQMERIVYRED